MSERRGIERALSNLFERTHGREPTDDELQEGVALLCEGIRNGPGPDTIQEADRAGPSGPEGPQG